MPARALEGLSVIAIEQAVAAPFATSRLADAGARVIKIERPSGDFARGYDTAAKGLSSYFVWLNRGKQSHVLDLTKAEAKTELEELLSSADVLVQNLKPGALARMGFDPPRLRQDFPRLISCSITGFGENGPMRHRKAYDLLIQAESGLCSITGGPEAAARVGISIVDIATGATAHAAILEALIRRGITGKGSHITISMFDVMADWLTVPLLNHEAGKTPQRLGMAHPSIAPYGVFTLADGSSLLISVQSDREWVSLATHLLQRPELAEDPRFATNVGRVTHRDQTDQLILQAFEALDTEAAIALIEKADVAFAQVNSMAELSTHPHLRRSMVDTSAGPIAIPAPAPIVDEEIISLGAVPVLAKGSK